MTKVKFPDWVDESRLQEKPGRPEKYPLSKMAVGEVIKFSEEYILPLDYKRFRKKVMDRGSVLKKKFFSRQLEDGTIEVCRVK